MKNTIPNKYFFNLFNHFIEINSVRIQLKSTDQYL